MMEELEPNFPLRWPAGWPVTKWREQSKFGVRGHGVTMTQALDFAEAELRRLGASRVVISCNVQPRLDGRPRGNQGRPMEPGVAVYFTLKQKRLVLASDKWVKPEDNLWAIAKHIEAMRGQARWGVGSVEQAFAGYTALPPKRGQDCWEQLGLTDAATEEDVMAAFRELARKKHPDMEGGSHEAFAALSEAKDIALATIRSRRKAA